jgi:divalent metal cation (Fe/Co/Zn/Cd) transporter
MSENQMMAAGQSGQSGTAGQAGAGRRAAMTVFHWALAAFLLLGAVQIFLAGLGTFSLFQGTNHAFDAHETVGFVMGGAAVVILVAALAARSGRAAIIGSVVLVVQTDLMQSLLAGLADNHALYGGLHAFDGLAAIGIAAWLWVRSRPRAARLPR